MTQRLRRNGIEAFPTGVWEKELLPIKKKLWKQVAPLLEKYDSIDLEMAVRDMLSLEFAMWRASKLCENNEKRG